MKDFRLQCFTNLEESFAMNRNSFQVRTLSAVASVLAAIAVIIAVAGVVPVKAQTPTTLYNFANGTSDAAGPTGNIVQGRDGNMYGVGALGGRGANRTGAVYKITPTGAESV